MSAKSIHRIKKVLLTILVVLVVAGGVASWRHRSPTRESTSAGKVVRDGDKWIFRTAKGDRVLVNSTGPSAVAYSVIAYVASLDAFHLRIRKGSDVFSRSALLFLVTDELVELPGRPVWNRDSTRFAAIGNGFESASDPASLNAASLWHASTLGCWKELDVLGRLNLQPSEWGASEASWVSDSLVTIKLVRRHENPTRDWDYASFDCRVSKSWDCLPTPDATPRADDPVERKLISESNGSVARNGDKLEFKTEKGLRVFQDVYDPHGDQGMNHHLVNFIGAVGAYQIHVGLWEGSKDLLLFLASNKAVDLPSGELTWNSSFTRFLMTYQDFESGYIGNFASLWSVSRIDANKEFDVLETLKPEKAIWGGAGGKWLDDANVAVDLVEPFEEPTDNGFPRSGKNLYTADCRHDQEWKCALGAAKKVYN